MYIDKILDSRILASAEPYFDASSIASLYFPSIKRFLASSKLSLDSEEKENINKQAKTIKLLIILIRKLNNTILEKLLFQKKKRFVNCYFCFYLIFY